MSFLDLLRTSIDPLTSGGGKRVMPPNTYNQPTLMKRIDITGNISVYSPGSAYDHLSYQSGAIIWNPSRGIANAYTYLFIPPAHVVFVDPTDVSRPSITDCTSPASSYFTFNTVLPIVNQSTVNPAQLTFSPSPDSNLFYKARNFTGYLKSTCGQVAVGATSLNGYFTASAVGTLSDVFQKVGHHLGPDPGGLALDPTLLVQNAVTCDDSVKEISAAKGVVSLIGPDISSKLLPPDWFNVRHCEDGLTCLHVSLGVSNIIGTGILAARGNSYDVLRAWFSPWNITLTDPVAPSGIGGVNVSNYFTGNPCPSPQDEWQYEVALAFESLDTVDITIGYTESFTIIAQHVYASANGNGDLVFSCSSESVETTNYFPANPAGGGLAFSSGNYKNAGGYGGGGSAVIEFGCLRGSFNSKNFQTGYTNANASSGGFTNYVNIEGVGQYLGTWIIAKVANVGTVASTWRASNLRFGSISVINKSINSEGVMGPVRIHRWDQMAFGQTIRVDGVIHTEMIPGPSNAAFVQAATDMSNVCNDVNSTSLLSLLYNMNATPWRRTWVSDQYDEYVRRQLVFLTNEVVAKILEEYPDALEYFMRVVGGISNGKRPREQLLDGMSRGMNYLSESNSFQESHRPVTEYGHVSPLQLPQRPSMIDPNTGVDLTVSKFNNSVRHYVSGQSYASPVAVADSLANLDKSFEQVGRNEDMMSARWFNK